MAAAPGLLILVSDICLRSVSHSPSLKSVYSNARVCSTGEIRAGPGDEVPHPTIAVRQSSRRIWCIASLVRVDSDRVCVTQRKEILLRLGPQAQIRNESFVVRIEAFAGARPNQTGGYRIMDEVLREHGCKISSPRSISVHEKGQTTSLEALAKCEYVAQTIDGAFFGRADDCNDCVHGLLVLERLLKVVFEILQVNARAVVHVYADDMVGANASNSCNRLAANAKAYGILTSALWP